MSHSPSFSELGLSEPLALTIERLGFTEPTPVQAACIPALLGGRDVLGEAQTGTGKTGAFGLPLIDTIDAGARAVQALVLAPTRELANQVAAALGDFARGTPGVDILPVYGGQPMGAQLRRLHAGPQIVVGTPGRIVDHMKRGTLKLDALRLVVLDEADEMLRMGFIDDIEWILEQTPKERQTALFSATMPAPIRRIAHRHLRDPEEIRIGAGNEAGTDIDQVYCLVDQRHKIEALGRMLEVETDRDAALVFARTKASTLEIADALAAMGHAVSALNGDMEQKERERVVAELRNGRLDVIVATDVAARGIDVPRISHVFNFDAPGDAEAYVHRIGRTGRAGRKGRAILLLEPRKRRILHDIERLTRKPVRAYPVPDLKAVTASREARFAGRVEAMLASGHSEQHSELVDALLARCNTSERDLASALVALATEMTPLLAPGSAAADPLARPAFERDTSASRKPSRGPEGRERRPRDETRPTTDRAPRAPRAPDADMVRYYMPVGRQDGIGAREIVGALTHEGGLSGGDIGRIGLMDHYSHVDLPATLNEAAIRRLARIHVAQRKLELTLETPEIAGKRPDTETAAPPRVRFASADADSPARPGKPARFGKPAYSKGGKAPQDRKRHAFAGPTAGRGRGPGPGKPFSARDAGTLAIRRKPV
jgi:ATP-dependent RNA helicase DeaD